MTELTLNINDEVLDFIKSKGYTPAQFFKNLFEHIQNFKELPFEFEPNETTIQAMEELIDNEKTKTLKEYDSWNEALKDILELGK